MKTINGKQDGFIGTNKIYIGRFNKHFNLKESPLYNPYKISKELDRENAIALYKQHLWKSIRGMRDGRPRRIDSIMAKLIDIARLEKELNQQGTEIELVCYCSPLPCHGDVIVAAIGWLKTQDWFTDWIR